MTAKPDEIIAAIRRQRKTHATSLNYDLRRITRDLQRQEGQSGRRFITRMPRKPLPLREPRQSLIQGI